MAKKKPAKAKTSILKGRKALHEKTNPVKPKPPAKRPVKADSRKSAAWTLDKFMNRLKGLLDHLDALVNKVEASLEKPTSSPTHNPGYIPAPHSFTPEQKRLFKEDLGLGLRDQDE